MQMIRPLPKYLVQRYHGWKATTFNESHAWFKRLAEDGQRPRAMLIACCDARVHVPTIFGEESDEFFIHRNIANLVPPYAPDGEQHGTSAAVEYAVMNLKVPHLIVVGHSNCGGVKACHEMCSGTAPELEEKTSFIGRWMDVLRPGYERISHLPPEEQIAAFEREAVLVSIANLMSFPFVREAVEADELSLHGLIHQIADGALLQYDPASEQFVSV